jgi:hypothetical protein
MTPEAKSAAAYLKRLSAVALRKRLAEKAQKANPSEEVPPEGEEISAEDRAVLEGLLGD